MKTQRRDFLKTVLTGGTGALITSVNPIRGAITQQEPTSPSPLNKWPGRVVVNFNRDAVKNEEVNIPVVKKMIEQSIKLLTGEEDIGAAWKAIFPETLSSSSKIAIKVVAWNPYKAGLHWSCARAVVDGLIQMEVDGKKFPASNIFIYEMNTSMVQNAFTVAGYTKENFPDLPTGNIVDKKDAIDGGDGALNNRKYARILKEADFLINLFNARGHQLPTNGSKFTLGFKSHYGSYENPSGLHSNWNKNFRDIVCIGPVYKKLVLSLCCALFGLNEGNGPGAVGGGVDNNYDDFSNYAKKIDKEANTKAQCTVIMSTDPVTAEMQAIKILRMNKDKSYGVKDMPTYLQAAAGITNSDFSTAYNIGVIDESEMDIRKIINDTIIKTPVSQPYFSDRKSRNSLSIHPNKGSFFIEFNLTEEHKNREAYIEIFNVKGEHFISLSHTVKGFNNYLSWNGKDKKGIKVASGLYIISLRCGITNLKTNFTVI